MSKFGTMDDFIRRMDEKRERLDRIGQKNVEDYASIDEYERDHPPSERLQEVTNRR